MSQNIESVSKIGASEILPKGRKSNQDLDVKAEFLELIDSLVSYQQQTSNELVDLLSDLASTPLPEEDRDSEPSTQTPGKQGESSSDASSDVGIAVAAAASTQVKAQSPESVSKDGAEDRIQEKELKSVDRKKVGERQGQDQAPQEQVQGEEAAQIDQEMTPDELAAVTQILTKKVQGEAVQAGQISANVRVETPVNEAMLSASQDTENQGNLENSEQNQGFQLIDEGHAMSETESRVQREPVQANTSAVVSKQDTNAPHLKIELEMLSRAGQFISQVSDTFNTASQMNTGSKPHSSLALSAMGEAKNGSGVGAEAKKIVLTKPLASRMLEKVDQVVRESLRKKDANTLSFKLDPPELGQMRVDIKLKDGALQAKLSPESQQVTAYLREHASDLQAMLRKLGLEVQTVTVSVSAELSGGASQESSMGNPQQQGFGEEMQNRGETERETGAQYSSGKEIANTGSEMKNDHWVA